MRKHAETFGCRASRFITDNEFAWVTFIRDCSDDQDPAPTLFAVQQLRRALQTSKRDAGKPQARDIDRD